MVHVVSMQQYAGMDIIDVMLADALRSELTVSLLGKESTDMNVRTKITSTTRGNIIIFTNFQTLGQLRDRNFRI